jgi:glycerol-3-phosphate acyltransferase PlsY
LIDLLAVVAAYLIGSVSLARLAARGQGIDITAGGSGNPGATNAARLMGRKAGALVLVGDLLKGVAGAALGSWLIGGDLGGWVAGAAAVVGHCYPVFYRFKGGKGVATAAGMILFQTWILSLVLTIVWAVLIRVIKISSVASLVVVVLAIPGVWFVTESAVATTVMAGVTLLIIARHRDNISRLRFGSEDTVA